MTMTVGAPVIRYARLTKIMTAGPATIRPAGLAKISSVPG